jgi:hypothetical protein
MPKILVIKETAYGAKNIVSQILSETEEEFEVHESLFWTDTTTSDVACGWVYDPDAKTCTDPSVEFWNSAPGKRQTMKREREQSYGSFGDQLDAIYRDMRDGTSKWVDHITAAKAKTAKVDAVDPLDKDSVLDSE